MEELIETLQFIQNKKDVTRDYIRAVIAENSSNKDRREELLRYARERYKNYEELQDMIIKTYVCEKLMPKA